MVPGCLTKKSQIATIVIRVSTVQYNNVVPQLQDRASRLLLFGNLSTTIEREKQSHRRTNSIPELGIQKQDLIAALRNSEIQKYIYIS